MQQIICYNTFEKMKGDFKMSKLNVPKAKIDHENAYDKEFEGEIARSYEVFKNIMEAGKDGFCNIEFSEYRRMYLEELEKQELKKKEQGAMGK